MELFTYITCYILCYRDCTLEGNEIVEAKKQISKI